MTEYEIIQFYLPFYLYNVKFKKWFSLIISFDLYISNYNILAVLTGHSRMRSHDLESR